MREGRIEQVGPPAEVYARPVSPYAANFLGVRNKLAVTRSEGGLRHGGVMIEGSQSLAASAAGNDSLQLFVRSRDTHVRRLSSSVQPQPGDIEVEGVITQVALGEGGRRQYVVDIDGALWYAQHGEDPDLAVGESVRVRASAAHALLYEGENLINH
jgi:iron(III) transport system ATP-binding protein